MKNVLLTTTALVAFAGAAAAADVALTYSGSAEAGYDFTTTPGVFYAEADMDIDLSLTQELNNGAVASLVLSGFAEWESADDPLTLLVDESIVQFDPSWVAMLETSYGSISAGDIDNANDGVFTEVAGMDVNVDSDDTDGDTTGTIWFGHDVHMLRADTTLGGFTLAASTNAAGDSVSANISGSAGGLDFALLFEEQLYGYAAPAPAPGVLDSSTVFGVNVSGDFSGVSFAAAYADDGTDTSMGVGVGYDISSTLSVSASYADNSTGTEAETAVGVAYDDGSITASADYDINDEILDVAVGYSAEVSPGVTASVGIELDDVLGGSAMTYSVDVAYVDGDLAVYAGYDDGEPGYYAGANYDLGGGASAFAYVSEFADAGPLEWGAASKVGIAMTF